MTQQQDIEELYDNVAENYKEAAQDHRKLAVQDYVRRLGFYDMRLAELGES
jgi:hypothetical protein